MISDLWTLQAASGGDELTFAEWGFSGATLTRANQEADVLTLTASVEDALAVSDLWEHETQVILRRDGEVYYRGYLAKVPFSLSPDGDMVTHEFRSIWWLLDTLDYRQDWLSLTGTGTGLVSTGRARLGAGEGGSTAAAMLAELSAFCLSMGISLDVETSLLPTTRLPLVEGHNRTVGELIREIFRWIPEVTLTAVYSASGTQLRAVSANDAPVALINVGNKPLSDLSALTELHEMRVDAVRVIYETTAPRVSTVEDTETTVGGFRRSDALVAAVDTWPAGATLTRKSLIVTLPHPAPLTPVIPTPQVTRQPVSTETWPAQGAFSNAAERWWLDRSELGSMGFTIDDIRLPREANETTILHRVILDPAVPVSPPSPVNPSSTPVWRPDVPEDTPRELMAGALADWMNVKQTLLIAQVTIAIRKSTADALSEPSKSAFFRLGPREVSSIAGVDVPSYLIDASYKFRGTNAVTDVYQKVLSVDYSGGTAASQNQAAYDAAVADAVVPGLARRLYDSLSPLYHAGSITLTAEEAPAGTYTGRCVRLVHPLRPAWSTMKAVVQSESVNIVSGTVSLTLGPPQHLAPQDWVALHAAARQTQERRVAAAAAPIPRSGADITPEPTPEALAGNPVIGSTYAPQAQFRWLSGGTGQSVRLWDVAILDTEPLTIRLACPGVVRKTDDVDSTSLVTIADVASTFTMAAGDMLVLEWTKDGVLTLKKLSTWSGHPYPYITTLDSEEFRIFDKTIVPLWVAKSTGSVPAIYPGRHIQATADLVLERLAPDAHFEIANYLSEHPSGKLVDVDRFYAGFGAA